jgi:hypothetical protein
MSGNLGYGAGKMSFLARTLHIERDIADLRIDNVKIYGLYPGTVATPNLMPSIEKGEVSNPTTLDSVVDTAIDLITENTPTNHAYIGFEPGKGIVRRYFKMPNPEQFILPEAEVKIVNKDFDPSQLSTD